jgi:hypothetical protein
LANNYVKFRNVSRFYIIVVSGESGLVPQSKSPLKQAVSFFDSEQALKGVAMFVWQFKRFVSVGESTLSGGAFLLFYLGGWRRFRGS